MTEDDEASSQILQTLRETHKTLEVVCSNAVAHYMWALYTEVKQRNAGSVYVLAEFQRELRNIPACSSGQLLMAYLSDFKDLDFMSELLVKYKFILAKFSASPAPDAATVFKQCAVACARLFYRRPELFYEERMSVKDLRKNLDAICELARSGTKDVLHALLSRHVDVESEAAEPEDEPEDDDDDSASSDESGTEVESKEDVAESGAESGSEESEVDRESGEEVDAKSGDPVILAEEEDDEDDNEDLSDVLDKEIERELKIVVIRSATASKSDQKVSGVYKVVQQQEDQNIEEPNKKKEDKGVIIDRIKTKLKQQAKSTRPRVLGQEY